MSFSNHIAFDQIRDWPPGKVATLSVEELALLLEDVNDAKARLAEVETKLRGGLDLKYGPQASTARKAAGKDTGTARVMDGRYVIVADLPKRVKWDQALLASAVRTIVEQWRDDPAQYVTTEYKVSETAYSAWPEAIRKLFEPARTVEHGKPIRASCRLSGAKEPLTMASRIFCWRKCIGKPRTARSSGSPHGRAKESISPTGSMTSSSGK